MKTEQQIREGIAEQERECDYWRNESKFKDIVELNYSESCRVSALLCVAKIEALKWVLG